MQLSQIDLLILSQCAIAAAYQAGFLINTYAGDKLKVNKKAVGTNLASQVVTEVDHLSQATILNSLAASCEKYDIAVLTEESEDDGSRLKKEHFWSIDPLDGTLAYIESKPGYAVSIALLKRDGTPLIGVIYNPSSGNLYHAVKGHGAFRNNRAWQLNPHQTILPSTQLPALNLICDRGFRQTHYYSKVLIELESVLEQWGCQEIIISNDGGAAMNACWVLEKAPACYFKFPKLEPGGGSLWDFSASACIFNEIGASVSDIYGQALQLNQADSTFMNHRGVIYTSHIDMLDGIKSIFKNLSTAPES